MITVSLFYENVRRVCACSVWPQRRVSWQGETFAPADVRFAALYTTRGGVPEDHSQPGRVLLLLYGTTRTFQQSSLVYKKYSSDRKNSNLRFQWKDQFWGRCERKKVFYTKCLSACWATLERKLIDQFPPIAQNVYQIEYQIIHYYAQKRVMNVLENQYFLAKQP